MTANSCSEHCPGCGQRCLGAGQHGRQTTQNSGDQHCCDHNHVWRTGAAFCLRLNFTDLNLDDLGELIRDMPPEIRGHFNPRECQTPFALHALATKIILLDERNEVPITAQAREQITVWAAKLEKTEPYQNEYQLRIGDEGKLLLELFEGTSECEQP